MRTLKATPLGPRLPPLAAAEAHSDPPHRRLSGIEPQQPDAPKTTTSATDSTLPPRCRSRPATLAPPQDAYQLQLCRARRATSPRFPISPALLHQHHAQPRPRGWLHGLPPKVVGWTDCPSGKGSLQPPDNNCNLQVD